MRYYILLTLWLWLAVGCFAQQSQIQTSDEVRRRQDLQQQATQDKPGSKQETVEEIVPGEMSDTGPQFVIQKKLRRKWFEASADSQYYYTSNMFMQEKDPVDTAVLVSTAQFALAPDPFEVLEGQLYPRLGFRHQWYNYAVADNTRPTSAGFSLNNFDFDSQTVFTDVRFRKWENWIFSGGFEWQRLLTHEPPRPDYQEFYKEYTTTWGAMRLFPINDTMLFTVGYDGAFRFTELKPSGPDPDVNDRTEHALTISYLYQPMENVLIQPFGRYQYTRYTRERDPNSRNFRTDHLYSTGLNVSYSFNEFFTVRSFISFDHRESEDSIITDYSVWNSGAGVSATLRF